MLLERDDVNSKTAEKILVAQGCLVSAAPSGPFRAPHSNLTTPYDLLIGCEIALPNHIPGHELQEDCLAVSYLQSTIEK